MKINDEAMSCSFLLGVGHIQPALDCELAKMLSQQPGEFPHHFGPLFSPKPLWSYTLIIKVYANDSHFSYS